MPAVQQGDHRCSGKWHPQGLSLACDRPRSVLAALSPLRVSEFVVSASARACAKGWCGGEWWHMVLCPAWMTCQHTHVHGRTDTVGCTHTRLFTFSATPVLGGTWGCHTRVSVCVCVFRTSAHMCVCVCRTNAHMCVHTGYAAQAHAPPRVSVSWEHTWPRRSRDADTHDALGTCMNTRAHACT